MPSTVTSYFTFFPATKARSSQVNTNFSNYRGDLLPINETTTTASDLTHNLGSTDHRWLNMYGSVVNLNGSTSTAHTTFKSQTSVTAGAAEILLGSSTSTVFRIDGVKFKGSTSTVDPIFQVSSSVTTGAMDLLFGSNTISSWSNVGMARKTVAPPEYTTSSGALGQSVIGVTTLSTSMSTTTTISTIRINARANSIVRWATFANRFFASNAQPYVTFTLLRGDTTTALSAIYTLTTTLHQITTSVFMLKDFPGTYYDNSYTAGEVVYQLQMIGVSTGTASLTAAFIVGEI